MSVVSLGQWLDYVMGSLLGFLLGFPQDPCSSRCGDCRWKFADCISLSSTCPLRRKRGEGKIVKSSHGWENIFKSNTVVAYAARFSQNRWCVAWCPVIPNFVTEYAFQSFYGGWQNSLHVGVAPYLLMTLHFNSDDDDCAVPQLKFCTLACNIVSKQFPPSEPHTALQSKIDAQGCYFEIFWGEEVTEPGDDEKTERQRGK
jgi:hypothetical protein